MDRWTKRGRETAKSDGGEREGCGCVCACVHVCGEEDGELVSRQKDAEGEAEGGQREWGSREERGKDMITSWKLRFEGKNKD